MCLLVMFAEALTVIPNYEHQRAIVLSLPLQAGKEMPQGRIGIGNLSVVKAIAVSSGVRRGRFIGIVRIVQMHPYKAWTSAMLSEPTFRVLHDFRTAPLDAPPARLGVRVLGKVIVVVKTAIQAGRQRLAIEDDSANKRGSRVSLFL